LFLIGLGVLLLGLIHPMTWGTKAIKAAAAWSQPMSAQSSGTFTDSGQALSTDADDVALGDLDGDGDLDIYLARNGSDKVWINQGNTQSGALGTFLDSGQNLGASYSCAVALADLDGDGDLDAFIVEDDATGNAIWINQGGVQGGAPGVFASNGQTIGNDLSSNVALGDVDGDGDQDAFVTRNVGRPNKVWLNNGAGQFTDSGQNLGSGSSSDVALGDVDGDRDLDAFVADADLNTIWVNQGGAQSGITGTFLLSQMLAVTGTLSIGVSLGDVDRDGDLDAVTAHVNSGNRVWVNQGGDQGGAQGVFILSQSLGPNSNRHVTFTDVDVDGDLDLFVARAGPNKVWVNQGGIQSGTIGNFQDSNQSLDNLFSPAAALGDTDADNDPDAVVANFTAATQVWFNQGLSGLQVLYKVRDQVMTATPRGQHYTNLFYTHNPEILNRLLANPALFDQGYETVVMWLPNLEALVTGNGNTAVITSPQVQAVDNFLTNLSAAASPALQQVIAEERAALPPLPEFVGKTMNDARTTVLGKLTIHLPVAVNSTMAAGDSSALEHAVRPAVALPGSLATQRVNTPQGGRCVLYCLLTGDCD
jgi:hypothetical protein